MAPKQRASASPAWRSTRSKSPAAARAAPAAKGAKPSSKTWSGLQPWTGEEDYYCLGRPKPLFRGQLHLYSALLSPVWSGFQLSLCHTAQEVLAVILACIGATAMLGLSGRFHTFKWQNEREEYFAGLLDYCGIYLQIAFSGTPLYVLLLPSPLNWCFVGAMAACALAGIFVTFSPAITLSRHTGTYIYCLMGTIGGLPLFTAAAGESVWSQLIQTERHLLVLLAASYLVGSQIYNNKVPKLWEHVFGFNELWHLLVVVGSACSYATNCSLLMRRAGIAA